MSLDEPLRIEGLGGGQVSEDEDEDDPDGFESTGTFDDLLTEADPEIFDRTFQATKSDVPIATGDGVPIPRPWQGIPRVAMVFNFNYVWDSDIQRWIRDEGNGGNGLNEVAAGEFVDLPQNTTDDALLGINTDDLGGDVLLWSGALGGPDPGQDMPFNLAEKENTTSGFSLWVAWGNSEGDYRIFGHNHDAFDKTVAWKVFRV